MTIFTQAGAITALNRAALAMAMEALHAGEGLTGVGDAFEEEYCALTGSPAPRGARDRLFDRARVCAAWLPAGLPPLAETAPAAPEPAPELPEGWTLHPCDYTGYTTPYGVYWQARGPRGQHTEPFLHEGAAAFWARRLAALAAPEHEEEAQDDGNLDL